MKLYVFFFARWLVAVFFLFGQMYANNFASTLLIYDHAFQLHRLEHSHHRRVVVFSENVRAKRSLLCVCVCVCDGVMCVREDRA